MIINRSVHIISSYLYILVSSLEFTRVILYTQFMAKNPYSQFIKKELILRDHLAIDRTILANERSLLAYVRTGFTIFLAAVTLIKLFDAMVTHIIGWILMIISLIVIIFGFMRMKKMKRFIHELQDLSNVKETMSNRESAKESSL